MSSPKSPTLDFLTDLGEAARSKKGFYPFFVKQAAPYLPSSRAKPSGEPVSVKPPATAGFKRSPAGK